ncbi:MAG: hypothetical protein ACYDC8_17550 [Gammaproteobacteria bacterium]
MRTLFWSVMVMLVLRALPPAEVNAAVGQVKTAYTTGSPDDAAAATETIGGMTLELGNKAWDWFQAYWGNGRGERYMAAASGVTGDILTGIALHMQSRIAQMAQQVTPAPVFIQPGAVPAPAPPRPPASVNAAWHWPAARGVHVYTAAAAPARQYRPSVSSNVSASIEFTPTANNPGPAGESWYASHSL